ncbi:hypothetical protein [Nocardia jiangxiensis]|uniref:Uncharacterized protein n=1 Tax=Nocardia jiangxiensis TaxID=282685 RepID=A0ABW6RXU0_9NOCA|nr:hypothetical protein [Nocardia jiangxiensis]
MGIAIGYRLLTGDDIAEYLPWLRELYGTSFRRIAERYSGLNLETDSSVTSAVNINVLRAVRDTSGTSIPIRRRACFS